MLSRPPTINASIILQQSPLNHDNYIEQYIKDEYFKDVYESLMHGTQIEELNYLFMINYYIILPKFVFHIVKEFM